ncbi:hypothetical protein P5673_029937, partial [Acropora cervicornis]
MVSAQFTSTNTSPSTQPQALSDIPSSTYVLQCASEPTHPENNDLTGELNQFTNSITFWHGSNEVHKPSKNTNTILPDKYETTLNLKKIMLLKHDALIMECIKIGSKELSCLHTMAQLKIKRQKAKTLSSLVLSSTTMKDAQMAFKCIIILEKADKDEKH